MKILALIALAGSAFAQESADAIMARVAANQDRSQAARESMVYEQDVLIRMQRANKKLSREESYQFVVTPTKDGIKKEPKSFAGKYAVNGEEHSYDKPGFQYKELDIDGEVAHELVDEFTNDKSRDGIAKDLFPLRAEEIEKYRFKLKGRQQYRGRDVYVVGFEPKKASLDDDSRMWAGETLVDTTEYQPVLITTWMARGLPLAVKTLLGTDLKQMGFKLAYEKFDNEVWMPVNYGGELYVRAVFFYKRHISLSLRNSGFRRANVESTVSYTLPPE
jgi:hypothetical protein